MFDHVIIDVADLERARRFYERALGPLGYEFVMESDGRFAFGRDGRPDFWIADRGTGDASGVHLAFTADDHAAVDAFHREAIGRVAGLLPLETLGSLREDPVIERLLETYVDEEEEPEDLAATLEDALDEIRPYLHSHGGEMEVLDVSEGVVRLRLMGSCDGCPSSTLTLTQGVEKILRERWPSFRGIEVEGAEEEETPKQQKLLSIQSMRRE